MARNLIGTGADQVSTNGMLGELAFQAKENINFSGGTGKLSKLDIDSISTQLGVSAVDVFVYDTSKDSDGGAWRRGVQNTSWYNETLSTSVRGVRKDFPSVAVIVATSSSVTIYDADDSSLPMWMVFNGSTGTLPYINATSVSSVVMMNGLLVMGSGSGLSVVHFPLDQMILNQNTSGVQVRDSWLIGISNRTNSGTSWQNYGGTFFTQNNSYFIPNNVVNDVAITVLPGAPTNALGLAVPTVAAATNAGVTVFKHDGTSVNLSFNDSYGVGSNVNFVGDKVFFVTDSGPNGRFSRVVRIPGSSITVGNGYRGDNAYDDESYIADAASYGTKINICIGPFNGYLSDTAASATTRDISTNYGAVRIVPYPDDITKSLFATIGIRHNTGYMMGQTKGAWLCDTVPGTLVRTELLTNGDFSGGTTGWAASSGATISVTGGVLRVTNGATNGRAVSTTFATVPSRAYKVKVTGISKTSSVYHIEVRGPEVSREWSSGTYEFTFTANANTTFIEVYAIGGAGVYSEYDNITVTEADTDKSFYGNSLEVYGTITKTPVAPGAEINYYSNFTTNTNYFVQPYNSNLDFGTGDFTIAFWMNPSTTGDSSIIYRGTPTEKSTTNSPPNGFCVWTYGGYLKSQLGPGVMSDHGFGVYDGNYTWHQVIFTRRSGTVYCYVDARLTYSGANTTSVSGSASTNLYVGEGYYSPGSTRLSLLRISASSVTAAQVLKMYNDEKQLFVDNAKATLYGVSEAATALAYDPDTKLLHVGTASGRSTFNGLRRVDNTTTAVSTSISAVNGLVAEQ